MLINEKIKSLHHSHICVIRFAETFPNELVKIKPDEIAFSANEIIYHLLEVDELWQRRIDQLLHSENKHFQQIDPDALAKENHYNEKSYEEGIAKWKSAREKTIDIINKMSDAELHLIGIHSRYGEMDTFRILDIIADHDLQHLRQLERTLALVKQK